MPLALITGASRGLGLALAQRLAADGWQLLVDARGADALHSAVAVLGTCAVGLPGDVADEGHRERLGDTVRGLGRLDLLVNNASVLGPSPLPPLERYPITALEAVLRVDTLAPLDLIRRVLPQLRESHGVVVNVSSDAAVAAYPGWGGYGASKAALDLLSAVLAVELPELAVYAFDPGDMRTAMHAEAFPGEDISDRPEPPTVVPALLRLLQERPPSGRYRAADLLTATGAR
ncbi:MAG TPA: SDR family oxidoreductase [Mycobacteriales bacterium]|nr:SDR family oxidoreductase [Mycobacteriales bacterium]